VPCDQPFRSLPLRHIAPVLILSPLTLRTRPIAHAPVLAVATFRPRPVLLLFDLPCRLPTIPILMTSQLCTHRTRPLRLAVSVQDWPLRLADPHRTEAKRLSVSCRTQVIPKRRFNPTRSRSFRHTTSLRVSPFRHVSSSHLVSSPFDLPSPIRPASHQLDQPLQTHPE